MIKKEIIIATDVFQELPAVPYQQSLILSCLAGNIKEMFLAESKNALDNEVFEIGPGQSFTFEWSASRKNLKYWIKGESADVYQIITV